MKLNIRLAAITCLTLFIGSCATVHLSKGGDKIRVLAPSEVSTCRLLGMTNASVTASALGVPRPVETIGKELATIARNSASNMGGDTIVPFTVVAEGQQTFQVYKCINPEG
ncbi:MAG: DUF4156 domain-containing protein [Gammaproteobacteria bacterium]|nr:DUF4156 domain-containing protein [Gammaproteobacteria bacterium]